MYNKFEQEKVLDVDLILDKAGVTERMHVADLGCGTTGRFVFPTAKIVGQNGQVFAVDILRTALDTVNRRIKQENLPNVKTVWSDIEIFNATKIESGSLDIVLLINTLHISQKRAAIIRESVRMLKKDGKVIVVEWKNVAIPFGPPAEAKVKIDALKAGAQKLGLKLEKEFFAGQYHYGLIFTKM